MIVKPNLAIQNPAQTFIQVGVVSEHFSYHPVAILVDDVVHFQGIGAFPFARDVGEQGRQLLLQDGQGAFLPGERADLDHVAGLVDLAGAVDAPQELHGLIDLVAHLGQDHVPRPLVFKCRAAVQGDPGAAGAVDDKGVQSPGIEVVDRGSLVVFLLVAALPEDVLFLGPVENVGAAGDLPDLVTFLGKSFGDSVDGHGRNVRNRAVDHGDQGMPHGLKVLGHLLDAHIYLFLCRRCAA